MSPRFQQTELLVSQEVSRALSLQPNPGSLLPTSLPLSPRAAILPRAQTLRLLIPVPRNPPYLVIHRSRRPTQELG